jgi:4-amino-4-deoxy-L-arabinose transferase-like glycosyltransferase
MKMQKIANNPYLLFSPFLVFFAIIVFKFHTDAFEGDESRYYQFAANLLNGFYSPPAPNINLWNGPGYPMVLMPFVALGLPLISITLLNALLHYLSIVLLFKSAKRYTSYRKALIVGICWGLYYTTYIQLPEMYTESLMYFLITLFIWSITKAFQDDNRKYTLLSGLIAGYIVLTKILFGYVILLMLAVCLMLWLAKKGKEYRISCQILGIAFLVFLPWLVYTYSLTKKPLYFGNSGGVLLYWMSTPHEGELGDWKEPDLTTKYKAGTPVPSNGNAMLKKNHQESHSEIFKHTGVERDEAYKRIAVENIKQNPTKFIKNWIANIGRLLFDFPNTYVFQNTNQLFKLPPNTSTVFLSILCLIPTLLNWRKIPFQIRFLLMFALIYLAPTTLLSAYSRFFTVIVPILLVWIAYIIQRTMRLRIKFR